MTTNYHTDHAFGAPLTSAEVNGPLGTLDRAITRSKRSVLNIEDYGAVADGTLNPGPTGTDNRAAIQSALDALNAVKGGTLYIPPGVYYVSDVLTMYGGTHIIGAGRAGKEFTLTPLGLQGSVLLSGEGKNILQTDGTDIVGGNPAISGRTVEFSLSNLRFKNGSVNATNGLQNLVDIRYAGDGVVIDSCIFDGGNHGGVCGLRLKDAANVNVRSSLFEMFPEHTTAAYTRPAAEIAPSVSSYTGGFPIQNIAFRDCTFMFNGRNVDVGNKTTPANDGIHTVIFDNIFMKRGANDPFDATDLSRGISCYAAVRNMVVTNCKFEDVRQPLTPLGTHIRLKDILINHAEYGIYVDLCSDVIIDGLSLFSSANNPIATGVYIAATNTGSVVVLNWDLFGGAGSPIPIDNQAGLLGAPVGIYPTYGGSVVQTANINTANRCVYVPVQVLQGVKATGVKYVVGVQSGNMSVGLYDASGARLATSGAVAVPAAGVASTAFTTAVYLTPGIYYLAISCDNITATFGQAQTGVAAPTAARYQAAAHPCPSPAAFAGTTNLHMALVGTVTGSYI